MPVSSTAQDCLLAAVTALSGHGALKDRIACAWSAHLDKLDPLLLPETVRAEFILLGALLHSVRALPGDTTVRASVRKLSPVDAEHCSSFIVCALACTVAQSTSATLESEAARVAELGRAAEAGREEDAARVPTLRIAGAG
jgi:hypothetical protein